MVPRARVRAIRMSNSSSRVAIIAALPHEIAVLTRGWRRQALVSGSRKLTLLWSELAVAVSAGMGGQNAVRALDAVRILTPVSAVVSAGFAGALTPDILVGQVLRPSTLVDARTGERFSIAEGDGSCCVTLPVVAGKEEKSRLAATYQAQLVEMEAASLARVCSAQELPFYAFKAISDASDFSLPGLENYVTPEGEFRTSAFALHLAVHRRIRPWLRHGARYTGRGHQQLARYPAHLAFILIC
jgi:adenosylhomocysteine nucleosidase